MNDLGLVSIMPPAMFLALIVLTVSFCLNLRTPEPAVLLVHLLALIVMLFGVMSIVAEAPRFSTTWVHIGFVEYIQRTGTNAVQLDARFSWPGFFALGAQLNQLAGYDLAIPYVGVATLFFNLVYLPPLYLVLNSLTDNPRLVWFALFLWYITNWIGQDYFAPQALNFLFFITILAVVLHWFRANTSERSRVSERFWLAEPLQRMFDTLEGWLPWARWLFQPIEAAIFAPEPPNSPSTPGQRTGLLLVVVVLMGAMAGSHQLTPFFTFFALTMLIVLRRTYLYGLSGLSLLLTTTWIAFMTTAYLSGHLNGLLEDLFAVSDVVAQNVAERTQVDVSAARQLVLNFRLLSTLGVWGLAGLGALRLFFARRLSLSAPALAAAPFLILALQSYGGEGLLRVYFFALAPMVLLVAGLFYSQNPVRPHWLTTASSTAAALLLVGAFLFTRYGNEKMDFMSNNDMQGMQRLYDLAPPNSLVLTYAWNGPQLFREVEQHTFYLVQDDYPDLTPEDLAVTLADPRHEASFLFTSRAGAAYGELFKGLPLGWQTALEDDLTASGYFDIVYENPDFRIYTLAQDPPTPPTGGVNLLDD